MFAPHGASGSAVPLAEEEGANGVPKHPPLSLRYLKAIFCKKRPRTRRGLSPPFLPWATPLPPTPPKICGRNPAGLPKARARLLFGPPHKIKKKNAKNRPPPKATQNLKSRPEERPRGVLGPIWVSFWLPFWSLFVTKSQTCCICTKRTPCTRERVS